MATARPDASVLPEAEDLVFRHRTLASARRILDAELRAVGRPPHRDDLYIQRLRRLRIYVRNSIAALEQRMEALGVAILMEDEANPPPDPAGLPPRRPQDFVRPAPPGGPIAPD